MSEPERRRVAVVTGASAGIGKAAARMLVADGWHVIGTGRDPARSAAAAAELRAAAGATGRFDLIRADFDSMREVRQAAATIATLTDRVQVLVNNAGGVRDGHYVTVDGFEAMFAANHLAAFLLTRALMPLLEKSAATSPVGSTRVIAVSSLAHERCPAMHWADLNLADGFDANRAYCQAKLANLLFTRELQRRSAGDGIVAQAMHPGRVASNFASHGGAAMQGYFATAQTDPPEQPAATLVWLATAPEAGIAGGRYFHDMAETTPAPQALEDAAARRLWTESEALLARIAA